MDRVEDGVRATLSSLIARRNLEQTERFAGVMESHRALLASATALQQKNEKMHNKLIILQHQGGGGSGGAGGDSGGDGGGSEPLSKSEGRELAKLREETGKMREKLHAKQEELSEAYKASHAAKATELELSRAKAELLAQGGDLSAGRAAAEVAVKAQAQAQRDLSLLQDEHRRVRALLEAAEHETRELGTQNRALVGRLIEEKGRLAEELNKMTTIMAQAQAAAAARAADASSGGGAARGGDGPMSAGGKVGPLPARARHTVKAHEQEVKCVALGQGHVITGGSDSSVKVWGLSDGLAKQQLRGPSQAVKAVDCNAQVVVGASDDRTCTVWSVETGRMRHSCRGHAGKLYSVRLLPGQQRMATGSTDRSIKLWELGKGNCERTWSCTSTCNALAYDTGAGTLASGHQDATVRLWDVRADSSRPFAELTSVHSEAVTSVAFDPCGGRTLLTNSRDNSLALVDMRNTFEPVATFRAAEYRVPYNWSNACFAPDGAHFVAGSSNGALYIWRVPPGGGSGEVERVLDGAHQGSVAAVAWSGIDGGIIASADQLGLLRVWEKE